MSTVESSRVTDPTDSVFDLIASGADSKPIIVQISDVHGYIQSARSALLAIGEIDEFPPLVKQDGFERVHWAGGDQYVLVFNGDMVDRGPANDECLNLVWRLQREAPPGHVRYHQGNHEMAFILPTVLSWESWYSGQQPASVRNDFYEAILNGQVTAAFEGYRYTYSHAGSVQPIDPAAVNASLREAAKMLRDANQMEQADVQYVLVDRFPTIFGMGQQRLWTRRGYPVAQL